jgi:8-oxo-dGTP pyrophosphatase MutT (NUDIX family)
LVVLAVGGSKAFGIKLVVQREPRHDKKMFLAGSILPSKLLVDAAVRALFEATGLTLTVDNLTLFSGNHVHVPMPTAQYQLVHV